MNHTNGQPFNIGSLPIDFPFLLAPMAGYTHLPYREICHRFGAGLCYTELVVAEGTARRLPPTMIYLETSTIDSPVGAHLYGSEPSAMARAAVVIEETASFDLIDINAGCPVRKVTSKGAGVALMRDPERIYEMVRQTKEAVHLPVTVKTRLGRTPGTDNIDEVAAAIQEAGADAITVHARFASDRHKGDAHWDRLRTLKSKLHIPLIGNGGVQNAASAIQMKQETGVDAVMIGRAALGNPWIFSEITSQLEHRPWIPPTREEKHNLIMSHARQTIRMMDRALRTRRKNKYSPEQAGCRLFRAHLARYFRGYPGLKKAMLQCDPIDSLNQIERFLAVLL